MSEQKSKWEEFKEKYNITPLDYLNPNTPYLNDEDTEARYNICIACPELIKLTKQCKKCGCFMKGKTRFKEATCPIGKW